MTNRIRVDLERTAGAVDPNIFGGFAEHLGRCIYGGIYEPGSPLVNEKGFRADVLDALHRLNMPVMRYPGGNFVSGYRWRDGVGPVDSRPARLELAWHDVESNRFGTNEFIQFCREIDTEPYLVVNAGDGDMREARDWLEYCNGTADTDLVRMRRMHGSDEPHRVKYWGIGNEVDGDWQIGHKTPKEYARTYREFAKVMKWTDPDIKLLASATCKWDETFVERAQLLLEQAGDLIDYMAIHWYVGNSRRRGYADNDFAAYMAISELIEDRLTAYEGIINAMRLAQKIERPIHISVDEWNVWYRVHNEGKLEEVYNLEDALVIALQLNAFIRHARTVKMANIAQIVNVIAPIMTSKNGIVLQTIFHPFEVYSQHCGNTALDVYWSGDTFSGAHHTGLRVLDVSATLNEQSNHLVLFVVNRSEREAAETTIDLIQGKFAGPVQAHVVNGPDPKAENTFESPEQVGQAQEAVEANGSTFTYVFEPHSVTCLVCPLS